MWELGLYPEEGHECSLPPRRFPWLLQLLHNAVVSIVVPLCSESQAAWDWTPHPNTWAQATRLSWVRSLLLNLMETLLWLRAQPSRGTFALLLNKVSFWALSEVVWLEPFPRALCSTEYYIDFNIFTFNTVYCLSLTVMERELILCSKRVIALLIHAVQKVKHYPIDFEYNSTTHFIIRASPHLKLSISCQL